MPEEKSINGGELNPAIITQDDEFNKFLMTLPENQRQTPENKYYTYKMWKIAGKPKDFNQAIDMGLYHWNANDKSYHGNSVIYDEESDVYHFLKPKDHSTVQYELDWYNKGITTDDSGNQYELAGDSKAEWEDFRRNYYLDSSGDGYAYRRRPTLGVSDKARNGIMAALENGVKAALENKLSSINQSLQESRVNKFGPGGPKGAGQATYNHPKYNRKEEAAMYSYLRERGIPHTQASAIMGNIAVESMLDPNISQIGGGGGYGLIQATNKSRKKAFINYDGQPYEFGSDISPETQRQLDYIVDKGLNTFTSGEWRGNENIARARKARERFLKETNIDKASKIFTENYLRPGKPHEKRRRSMSRYFNDNYATTESALKEFENAFLFENN